MKLSEIEVSHSVAVAVCYTTRYYQHRHCEVRPSKLVKGMYKFVIVHATQHGWYGPSYGGDQAYSYPRYTVNKLYTSKEIKRLAKMQHSANRQYEEA